jgi:hypothetical protein
MFPPLSELGIKTASSSKMAVHPIRADKFSHSRSRQVRRGTEVNMTDHLTGRSIRVADHPGVGPNAPGSQVMNAHFVEDLGCPLVALRVATETASRIPTSN